MQVIFSIYVPSLNVSVDQSDHQSSIDLTVADSLILQDFGTELIVIHGGINLNKQALDDLHILQVEQQEWLDVPHSAVGPAARAFHAACVINGSVAIFAGHVYIPEKKLLHQFNDLWLLNSNTWQWHRCESQPDHPAPCPRDRSSMIALDSSRLLIYGGTDTAGKRLDDAWVYDIESAAWKEVAISGPRPRPRCCTALFAFGNRVLLFGGDAMGMVNDLWSLRGLFEKQEANKTMGEASVHYNNNGQCDTTNSMITTTKPPHLPSSPTSTNKRPTTPTYTKKKDPSCKWTQLQLEGNVPLPRRGHAIAPAEPWGMLIFGGLSEQKSMLGIKKQLGHLADLILVQRTKETLVWRTVVDTAMEGEEAHIDDVSSNSHHGMSRGDNSNSSGGGGGGGGMSGGISRPKARELHTLCALKSGRFFVFGGTDGHTVLGDAWWLTLEDISPPPPDMITLSDLEKRLSIASLPQLDQQERGNAQQEEFLGGVLHMPPQSTTGPTASPGSSTPSSYWATIPALAQQGMPALATAMPAGLTSAISSLRDRFAVGATSLYNGNITAALPAANKKNSMLEADAARAAALLAPGKANEDEQLLNIGRLVMSDNNTMEDVLSPDTLVSTARAYFSTCQPNELKIGHVSCLLRDYRRLSRLGWSTMIAQYGPDTLLEKDDIEFPGKFYHFMAEEVRMKDVGEILADYRFLLAQAAVHSDFQRGSDGGYQELHKQ